jgi:hypothetical protein
MHGWIQPYYKKEVNDRATNISMSKQCMMIDDPFLPSFCHPYIVCGGVEKRVGSMFMNWMNAFSI